MRWKAMVAAAFGCGLLAVVPALTFQGKTHNQAYASETVAPAAQPYNTVVRWTRETQKNNMGADIVMSQGYNLDGDTVVSILEDESPIITVSTYDETGNKIEVNSFDDGKQFVHSTYTYNEQGDQTSWVYQARTPEGVTETSYTYEYTYDGDDLTQKDSYQDGRLVSRETFTREQTDEGIVVRTVTDGDLVPDLTCYSTDGRPLWREKDTYRMVYYYDKLGRETENCVIADGMQQNRTLTAVVRLSVGFYMARISMILSVSVRLKCCQHHRRFGRILPKSRQQPCVWQSVSSRKRPRPKHSRNPKPLSRNLKPLNQ